MTKQENWIKLQIGSAEKGVSADGFLEFFGNTLRALKELDKALSSYGAETLQWQIIETGSASPIFAKIRPTPLILPGNGHSKKNGRVGWNVVTSFVSGMAQLNQGKRRPANFNSEVLGYIKKMASISDHYRFDPIIFTPARRICMEDSIAANADWAMKSEELKKKHYIEHGSIEGELRILSGGGGRQRDRLSLFNRITGEHIPCYVPSKSKLETRAREAWKQRVQVSGQIFIGYRSQRPIKIVAENIRILRAHKAPRIEDLPKIDITGGMESSEYVRRFRDAN